MASLVIGAIGAWLAPVGFAGLGFSIGSAIGNMLFPPEAPDIRQEGPRLGDLKVQTSTYGNPIPIVYGTIRITGNMIWSKPILETVTTTKQDSGGKGGGGGGGSVTQTTYSYSQSFAIALCEGPIHNIRKIWANGELIYNMSADADTSTIVASEAFAQGITVYTGTESQVANALIASDVGAANCPAYRGVAYVVFTNLQLAPFGNRCPNLEFEVVMSGTTDFSWVKTGSTLDVGADCAAYGGGKFQIAGSGGGTDNVMYSYNGINWVYGNEMTFDVAGPVSPGTMDLFGIAYGNGKWVGVHTNTNDDIVNSSDGINWFGVPIPYSVAGGGWSSWYNYPIYWQWDCVTFANGQFVAGGMAQATGQMFGIITSVDGVRWTPRVCPTNMQVTAIAYGGGVWVAAGTWGGNGILIYSTNNAVTWQYATTLTGHVITDIAYGNGRFVATSDGWGGGNYYYTSTNGASWGLTNALPVLSWPGGIAFGNGRFMTIGWGNTDAKALTSVDGLTWEEVTLPADVLDGDWLTCTYGGGRFVSGGWGGGTSVLFATTLITAGSIDLGALVTDICERAGLTTNDIDVNLLIGIEVNGYVVQRGIARGQIEPLMQAYFFDAVESDGKIKFVTRGNAAVLTIDEDDLAAYHTGSTPPAILQMNRQQEMELPVQYNIQYLDRAASYAVSTQMSQRLTTPSQNRMAVNLAMALTANQAKQIADVLMYDTWTARNTYEFDTSWKYSFLEPTDVINVTKGAKTFVLRLASEDNSSGIYKWRAVTEEASTYTQTASGQSTTPPSTSIVSIPTTNLMLLDIPLLRDIDEDYGFYAAANGHEAGWLGGQVYKSGDNGESWTSFGAPMSVEAASGVAPAALANFVGGNIFDETNTITVILARGELVSAAEESVLNGNNTALLGDEIIQYKNAELTGENTYLLSSLLRGRKGTEWAMSTHITYERFIQLTGGSTAAMYGPAAEYNMQRLYRAYSFNREYLEDPATITFTNTAIAKKPYACVHLGGGRNEALDVILTWIRRGRINNGWNSSADIPLGEVSEAYEVEIYSNNTYATLKRTITGLAEQTATYTAAEQTTDFGSTQAIVYFKVFQISPVVGRGYEARGVI